MNQQQLQNKRRKRQAKRKVAQVTARRRNHAEKLATAKNRPWINAGSVAPKQVAPGFFGKLFGGTQITPDQMDTEAAPISGGGA